MTITIEMAKEIDRLNADLELEKAVNAVLKKRLAKSVPVRDHDAVLKSMSVCQGMMERLMLALRKVQPESPVIIDALIILDLLEHLIVNNPKMQDEDWIAYNEKRVKKIKSANMKRAGRMLRTANKPTEKPTFSGKVKREIKP